MVGAGPGGLMGGGNPNGVQRQSPGRGPGDEEAEAKCKISVQFLTFSGMKFWI